MACLLEISNLWLNPLLFNHVGLAHQRLVIEDAIGGAKQILWNIDSRQEIRVVRGYPSPRVSPVHRTLKSGSASSRDHRNFPYRQHLISIKIARVYATWNACS